MLALPPFRFAYCSGNLPHGSATGTPPAATVGVNFSAGASNADGTAVTLKTNVAHDVHLVVIGIGGVQISNGDSGALADILVDPAGGTSWSAGFIDNLVCGYTATPAAGTVPLSQWYAFPVCVKAGTSFGIRARTRYTTASITSGRAAIWLFGEPSRPDAWWCGSRVVSIGISESTSSGTSVTPGNTGAWGTWTNIGGTTNPRLGCLSFGLNAQGAAGTALGFYWQMGVGSAQIPGTPTYFSSTSTAEVSSRSFPFFPTFVDVPAGAQLQVRATASGTAAAHDVALYGVA